MRIERRTARAQHTSGRPIGLWSNGIGLRSHCGHSAPALHSSYVHIAPKQRKEIMHARKPANPFSCHRTHGSARGFHYPCSGAREIQLTPWNSYARK